MSVVKGKNVAIFADGKVIACGRSCTLTTSTSFVETTTAGSGKGATFKPQKNTTTGSIEGVVYLGELGKYTLPELRRKQLRHDLFSGLYERTDEVGNVYSDVVDFYISNITDTGAVGDFNTFQIDLQVNGDPTILVNGVGGVIIYVLVDGNSVGGLGVFTVTWVNDTGGIPTDLSVEYSFDGTTWMPALGQTRTGDESFTYDLGTPTAVYHYMRITPFYSGQIGTPVNFYYSHDYASTFSATSITATAFNISTGFTGGVTWDLSLDSGATYIATGLTSTNYSVTGLTTGTTYHVVRRMHSVNGVIQVLPPVDVTTI